MDMSTEGFDEVDFMEAMESAGFDDVLVLQPETYNEILTGKRFEIIQQLREKDFGSIRELAREVDREPSAVHRNLKVLYEADLIDFEYDGSRKIPELRHDWVIVPPLDLRVKSNEK